ncbi:hypothetical protein NEDG_01781 [Nematocida displodere]|uniref:Uncharacterized protein n=1 Tax=Nematocida displodere TaxID=1805483 RepID=A0A177EH57_9MICR|nr:hypothetical protein NEDG_01781 [Nematocida displodere]
MQINEAITFTRLKMALFSSILAIIVVIGLGSLFVSSGMYDHLARSNSKVSLQTNAEPITSPESDESLPTTSRPSPRPRATRPSPRPRHRSHLELTRAARPSPRPRHRSHLERPRATRPSHHTRFRPLLYPETTRTHSKTTQTHPEPTRTYSNPIQTLFLTGVSSNPLNTNPNTPPSTLPYTEHTDPTIKFFDAVGCELHTEAIGSYVHIKNIPISHLKILLDDLAIENIPPKLQPSIQVDNMQICVSSTQAQDPQEQFLRLNMLLQALSSIEIQSLTLSGLVSAPPTQNLSNPKIPLYVTEYISFNNLSPSAIEWLGGCVDFSQCEENMELKIYNCSTMASLACLDSLNIQSLSRLLIMNPTNLESIDCQILRSGLVREELRLSGFLDDHGAIKIFPELTSIVWDDIYASIWISSLENAIIEQLVIPISNTEPGHNAPKTLSLHVPIIKDMTTALFDIIMEWIRVRFPDIECIYIEPTNSDEEDAQNITPALEAYIKQTPECLSLLPRLYELGIGGILHHPAPSEHNSPGSTMALVVYGTPLSS